MASPEDSHPAQMAPGGETVRETTRYQQGLTVRKEVLGDEHVARSLGGASEFSRPMQELVTEYAWGMIWSRPGLDRRTRSLLNIGMLTALSQHDELRAHVRGAVTNGCTRQEIREALLQAAVYCGLPASLAAFRVADSVLSGCDRSDDE